MPVKVAAHQGKTKGWESFLTALTRCWGLAIKHWYNSLTSVRLRSAEKTSQWIGIDFSIRSRMRLLDDGPTRDAQIFNDECSMCNAVFCQFKTHQSTFIIHGGMSD
jgi:hypothetical protein